MTTQSMLQSIGLSISVWEPKIVQWSTSVNVWYTPRGQLVENGLEERVSSYTHTMTSQIGFDSMTITIEGSQEYIEDWIQDGLNKHIEVRDAKMETVWEGFVNSYSANVGALTKTGGPVTDIINRCIVTYTPIDETAIPPARGPQTETTAEDNDDSKYIYGIFDGIIQGGEISQTIAEQVRDTQLDDFAWPKESTAIGIGDNAAPASITLDCLGYGARLDNYIVNVNGTVGVESVSDKVERALDADPSHLFSTKREYIEPNAIIYPSDESDNKTALNIIKLCLSVGTATDKRTFFGIYEDQIPFYWSEPLDILYRFRVADVWQDIEKHTWGAHIEPWNVRPGQWLFTTDFLAGRIPPPNNPRRDPRVFLIETVKFTAPYQLETNGERFGSIPQLLAKTGLGML
jgi:hypothetical protein